MADGRFLRAHGLKLYHLQYECLGLLSIGVPSFLIQSILLLWYVCNDKLDSETPYSPGALDSEMEKNSRKLIFSEKLLEGA